LLGFCAMLAAIALVIALLGTPQATTQMAALALPPIVATLWLTRRHDAVPSRLAA
jgi:hypothetical protein